MEIANFMGEEKGGLWESSLYENIETSDYIADWQQSVLFECHDVNKGTLKIYQNNKCNNIVLGIKKVTPSKVEKASILPNQLLYAAQASQVIVNSPSGAHKLVGEWFSIWRMKEHREDTSAQLFLWYVRDSNINKNLRLFGKSCACIPIQCIFVIYL